MSTLTFPVRLGLRIAHSAMRTGVSLSQEALGLLAGLASRGSDPGPPPPPPPVRPEPARSGRERSGRVRSGRASSGQPSSGASATPSPVAPTAPATREPAPTPAPPGAEVPPAAAPPPHVSTETTVVESFAEPGAEDGAGAELHVEAPWPGYGALSARDVIDRLRTAEPSQLTLVALYERTHRNRSTVIEAAERALRARS